jgi:hypothetical protein
MTWRRIRPWAEDIFAALCWLGAMAGMTVLAVGVGP